MGGQDVSPAPKKRRVAIALEEERVRDEGMMSPLRLLATVASQVAEEEEWATEDEPLHRNLVVGSTCDARAGAGFHLPPPFCDDPSRRGVIRMPFKKTMAEKAEEVLTWCTDSDGTAEEGNAISVAAAEKRQGSHQVAPTSPSSLTFAPIVAATQDEKRKAVAMEHNMPYKRLKATTGPGGEPLAVGWVEKMVRMGGWNPWLVVKKQLSNTDLSTHYSRLPLPLSKDSDPQRGGAEKLVHTLSDSELDLLWNGDGLPVTLLDRWGREYHGGLLRRWDSKGWIVLKGGGVWPGAARFMGLKAQDVVEVLSFRVRPPKEAAGTLVLVLLPAPRDLDAAVGGCLRPEASKL